MIKSATRRFANRKAEMTFSCGSYNKAGMNSARRVLDKSIVEEAVKAMAEPEPEVDYYMVTKTIWDEYDGWDWQTEGVYANYQDAALAAKTCGGNISITVLAGIMHSISKLVFSFNSIVFSASL